MNKNIIITQSNYIPWKGYFDAMNLADEFVLYDDMQYTKRDWRNRNLIKTSRGLHWLTIPVDVKGRFFQKINETKISDVNWNKNHWNILKENYSKAKKFKEVKDFIEGLYKECDSIYLSEINRYFLENIVKFLKIDISFKDSTLFELAEDRNDRLINICKDLNGTDYYSGPAAKSYMDETKFIASNITVHYLDYQNYKEYEQLYSPFEHGVSILDLIFNEGENARNFLKYNKD